MPPHLNDLKNDRKTRKKLAFQKSSNTEELKTILKVMPLNKNTTCGFGCFKGSFLQKFANQTSYIVVYGLVGCFFVATSSYFNGTISTIEKRFKIPSRNTGIIMIGNDITQVFCSAFLGYYAGKRHRPRWMGFGLMTILFFCMLTALPHFLYGPGENALSLTKEYGAITLVNITHTDLQQQKLLCRNVGIGVECEVQDGILLPQILLFLAQFIGGIGGSLYHILGVSYMDDNTEKSKAPAMLSISYFFGLLGPSLGYTLASMCLRLYIVPTLTPIITQSDSRWLGAWWLGWLILTGLLFLSGILLFMFPKELPITAARRKLHDARFREENNSEVLECIGSETSFRDMLKTVKNFLKNRTIALNLSANILYYFGYMPYWIFTAKYIEIQYRQTAATSSFVTGTVALVFSAIGILLSGFVMTKYKPSARCLAGWNAFVDIVTLCGMIAYVFIGCPANDNSLISNSYNSSISASFDCNSICQCEYVRYTPVCGEDQATYISPCHAGCRKAHKDASGLKFYTECSCIQSNNNNLILNENPLLDLTLNDFNNTAESSKLMYSLGAGGQAVDGACPIDCTKQFYTFLAVMCAVKLIAATGRSSNLLITVRSVAPGDKAAIMGFDLMLTSLLCFVPAPILYGWIFDQNCLVWGKTCTNKGNCWSYDSMSLRFNINAVASIFIALSTLCNVAVWCNVKHLKVFDDDDDKLSEVEKEEAEEAKE